MASSIIQPPQFSAGQIQSAFERIASMADTAESVLYEEQNLHSAGLILSMIGALADHMTGNAVKGSVGRWACGDSFATELGKKVQS